MAGIKAWAIFLLHLMKRETHHDFGNHSLLNKPSFVLAFTKTECRLELLLLQRKLIIGGFKAQSPFQNFCSVSETLLIYYSHSSCSEQNPQLWN